MPLVMKLRSGVWNLLRGARLKRELDEELRGYVEERTTRSIESGMAPDAARRAALIELGGVEQVKTAVWHGRIGYGIETTLQDIKYGSRALARTPGFAVVVPILSARAD